MDIHTISIPVLVDLNRVCHGQLHDALAAAWDNCGAQEIDLQVSHCRGIYFVHVTALVGDSVVFERAILIRRDRKLPEAAKCSLLLLWINCIQAKAARAMARADAVMARHSAGIMGSPRRRTRRSTA